MNSEQAKAVAADMERHGWNVIIKLQGPAWVVRAMDSYTLQDVTIKTPIEWAEIKAGAAPEGTQAPAQRPAAVEWIQGVLL